MLWVVATTGKQDAEVTEAYTLVENNAIKKYKKKEMDNIGTSKGTVQILW